MEALKKGAALIWMIFSYPVGILGLYTFLTQWNFKALFVGVFLIILSSFLFYIVFYNPKQMRSQKQKEIKRFFQIIDEEIAKLAHMTKADLKTRAVKYAGYKPIENEVVLAFEIDVIFVEVVVIDDVLNDTISHLSKMDQSVRYKFSAGLTVPQKQAYLTKQGRLLLTTQALVFVIYDDEKIERIKWAHMKEIFIYPEFMTVIQKDGKSQDYYIEDFSAYHAALINKLLQE